MPDNGRRGSALLDVVIAMTLLAIAGSALLAVTRQTRESLRSARNSERLTTRASAALDRTVTLDAADLGVPSSWKQDSLVVHLAPLGGGLADVVVMAVGGAPVLETTIYRPDTAHEAR